MLFCPCYLRIWIDSFSAVKIEDLSAELKVNLKFDLDITDIPVEIIQHIKGKLKLNFSHLGDPV